MNQLKVGAILSYVTLVLTVIVTLISTPIMIEKLGQIEFGIYSLILAFIGYLSILDFGLGNAIIRYISRTRADKDREQEAYLSGMFLILFSILGIIAFGVGLIMYNQIDILFGGKLNDDELRLAQILALILLINFSFSFPLSIFGAIVQAHERFIFFKITNIIKNVIPSIVIVPFLYLGYGSITVVVITSLINILALVLNVWYCFFKLKLKLNFRKFNINLLKEILIYSGFVFLTVIIDKIYWSTDQIILGAVAGASEVAIYALAMQFIIIYMSISTAISGLFLPKISMMDKKGESDEAFSNLFIKIGRLQAIIVFFVLGGFYIVGEGFIELWLGKEYIDVYKIVLIIMVPLSIPLIQNTGIAILQAKNLHGFRSITFFIVAVINFIVSIPIAHEYGYLGVATVTGITLFINQVVILNTYYYYKIKINILGFWKKILKIIIVLTMSSYLVLIGDKYLINQNLIYEILIKVIIYSLLYLIFTWFLILKTREKQQIIQRLLKIKRGLG
ncbi:MAG: oligosaccharide flippase family protein [Solibacillus sp.]